MLRARRRKIGKLDVWLNDYEVRVHLQDLEKIVGDLLKRVEKLEAEVREIKQDWLPPAETTLNELCEKLEKLEKGSKHG